MASLIFEHLKKGMQVERESVERGFVQLKQRTVADG